MSYSQVVDLLNQLLTSQYHADFAYKRAIEVSDVPSLKQLFMEKALEHGAMVNQITDDIIRLNGKPQDRDGLSETASNAWTKLVLFFQGNSEDSILEECKKAEKQLWQEYNEVLKHTSITGSTRTILEAQRDEIVASLENTGWYMKSSAENRR